MRTLSPSEPPGPPSIFINFCFSNISLAFMSHFSNLASQDGTSLFLLRSGKRSFAPSPASFFRRAARL